LRFAKPVVVSFLGELDCEVNRPSFQQGGGSQRNIVYEVGVQCLNISWHKSERVTAQDLFKLALKDQQIKRALHGAEI